MQAFKQAVLCDDGTLENAKYTREWISNLQEASKRFGKSIVETDAWEEGLRRAGFVDVTGRVFKVCVCFFS